MLCCKVCHKNLCNWLSSLNSMILDLLKIVSEYETFGGLQGVSQENSVVLNLICVSNLHTKIGLRNCLGGYSIKDSHKAVFKYFTSSTHKSLP